MRYDLYITNESRLSSPNANMVFKLGALAVILTMVLTLITWLDYHNYIINFSYVFSKVSDSSDVVIENEPMALSFNISAAKQILKVIHWFVLLLSFFYYYKAERRNESSLWVTWGLILSVSAIFHSYSIGEFYSIEFGIVDIAVRMLDNRYNR